MRRNCFGGVFWLLGSPGLCGDFYDGRLFLGLHGFSQFGLLWMLCNDLILLVCWFYMIGLLAVFISAFELCGFV